ncbi:uncharacterized protein PV07_09566 [Cladophialophora immunda]|uniref:PEBP-like protein n=1 Tax=Cladophialophora immunda TaxID=569365 RepID=A0A0D2C5S5_9EURO|nr:uncharacterized protein PV07_09566 [Cladophialophora immunda]KIW26473.1 hypothetical protein PV07_09566 [Cladophialophora immunda]OQV01142.1 hypothetical protein CLAIMM_06548 [Cladophialophora immunda]
MKYFSVLAVPTLAALVSAQSAPNFPVQVDNNLRVDFLNSSTSVSPAGILLPRDDVLYGPTVYGPQNATEEATYILFMVDEDVNTGNGPRVQLLHYFQPNLVGINHELSVQPQARNATTAVGAEYLTPSPPAGDGPHRYTLLLYPQPEGFTVPQAYISFSPPADTNARYPFNMSGFAEAAGLGQPVAANWFRVVNDTTSSTSTASSSAGPATATAATTSVETSAATSASASSGASASTSSAANAAAGLDEVRGSAIELVAGLALGIAGAWLWML